MTDPIFKSSAAGREVAEAYRRLLDAWPVPKTEIRLPTCAGETFVIAYGPTDAPPVMLFHGAQATAAVWGPDAAAWAQHFRVYAVDIPGDAGFSAPQRPPLGSDLYAEWFDDIRAGLGCGQVSLLGASLGGWLALDCAIRRPQAVARMALMCPAGIGRQKNLLARAWPYLFMGRFGQRKLQAMVMGPPAASPHPVGEAFLEFMALVMRNTRPRPMTIPRFSDADLGRLSMPVMVVVGGKDVLLESAETRDRLAAQAPGVDVRYLEDAPHVITGQTGAILDFLRGGR